MSESRVPENGMHGLIGGRWGQQAITSEIQRSTKMTTLRRATVSRPMWSIAQPAAYLTE
jgi:hypothetical protein